MVIVNIDLINSEIKCCLCKKPFRVYEAIEITKNGVEHCNCHNPQLRCDRCNNRVDIRSAFAANGIFYHEGCYKDKLAEERNDAHRTGDTPNDTTQ